MDSRSEGLLMAKSHRMTLEKQNRRQMNRIDILPDDVLLDIFCLYVKRGLSYGGKRGLEAWQSLVHVCRRWRSLVFGSPRCLNLQLFCTPQTPAKDVGDLWPALPLIITGNMTPSSGMDNIIAALGQNNLVCQVLLSDLAGWQLENVLAVMQVPFPELTDLRLNSNDKTPPVIPDSFLDGFVPRLRYLSLSGIPFPGLSNLQSATHLDSLRLTNIPHSGYISPEATVAVISVLSSLRTLSLEFQSPQSRPDWQSQHPPKRSILPSLNTFHFRGVTEYLEELVFRIDTPQLDYVHITFFNQIDFDCSRLIQFINCTPTLRAPDAAHVQFDNSTPSVKFRYGTSQSALEIAISCREPDWQLSSIEQICNSSLHPVYTVEDLYIERRYQKLVWKNDAIEITLWLELLRTFTTVKNLYLSKEFAPGIAAALQELVGGTITEVLPSLQNIFVGGLESSGPVQENIGQFVAARKLSDHPIVISVWHKYRSDLQSTTLDTVEYGAGDDDEKDEAKVSLHATAEEGQIDTLKSLLERGADVNVRNASDETPLHKAAAKGNIDVVRLFIERGAEVDSRDKKGCTPLHKSSRFGLVGVSRVLLDHGANVNARQQNYWTPMHLSAGNGLCEVVKLLIERGANIHAMNDEGETPYQVSLRGGDQEISDILQMNGAG